MPVVTFGSVMFSLNIITLNDFQKARKKPLPSGDSGWTAVRYAVRNRLGMLGDMGHCEMDTATTATQKKIAI